MMSFYKKSLKKNVTNISIVIWVTPVSSTAVLQTFLITLQMNEIVEKGKPELCSRVDFEISGC